MLVILWSHSNVIKRTFGTLTERSPTVPFYLDGDISFGTALAATSQLTIIRDCYVTAT